jgi:hypothetical protein
MLARWLRYIQRASLIFSPDEDKLLAAEIGHPWTSWAVVAHRAREAATLLEIDLQSVKFGHLAEAESKIISIALVMSWIDECPDHVEKPSLWSTVAVADFLIPPLVKSIKNLPGRIMVRSHGESRVQQLSHHLE